jgi:predicted flap endonuclease-1-like 5' DNA nuclease
LKKKTPEQGDPHERESHIAEGFEKHLAPSTTPMSITGIPMPLIAPSPVFTPKPAESSSSLKGELKTIKGINDETAAKLGTLGIENIDDLAKASPEALASELKVPAATVQKWIDRAKKLQ